MKDLSTVEGEIDQIVSNLPLSDDDKSKLLAGLLSAIGHLPAPCSITDHQDLLKENKGLGIQRIWRPIVMLTFALILLLGIFLDVPYLSNNSEFWTVFEIGIGGYALGRGVESITDNWRKPKGKKADPAKTSTMTEVSVTKRIMAITSLISRNDTITVKELAENCGVDENTIKRDIKQLKKENILRHIGPNFGGRWEVLNT